MCDRLAQPLCVRVCVQRSICALRVVYVLLCKQTTSSCFWLEDDDDDDDSGDEDDDDNDYDGNCLSSSHPSLFLSLCLPLSLSPYASLAHSSQPLD